MPERPPIRNRPMNATAYSIGGSNLIRPIHIVPIQLKILTPVGTPMANEASMNQICRGVEKPTANMWWPQTRKPRKAIATTE